jgi:hypothetical protein
MVFELIRAIRTNFDSNEIGESDKAFAVEVESNYLL